MNHLSGYTVDLSILDSDGEELDMGGVQYNKKDSIYYYRNNKPKNKKEQKIKQNRELLIKVMEENKFDPYTEEWWHWGVVWPSIRICQGQT
jgi:D-alanyl-D-alanine dipeptidase